MKKIVKILCLTSGAVLIALAFLLVRARFFLPQVDVPILLYDHVTDSADGKYGVLVENFNSQMKALAADGYKTVTPSRLRAYAIWGVPLPELPFMITFDNAYRNLLSSVKPILQENGFTAVVNLATTYIAPYPAGRRMLNGEPMLTWKEIKDEEDGEVFIFGGHTRNYVDLTHHKDPFNEIRASRSDLRKRTGKKSGIFSYPFGRYTPKIGEDAARAKIKFAMIYGDDVAKIGASTDFMALPRLRVVGGRHVFGVEAVEELSPGVSGKIRITHPAGPVFPMSVLVYDSNTQSEAQAPVARGEVADLGSDGVYELDLPADAEFPISVSIFDKANVVLYFSTDIPYSALQRSTEIGQPTVKLNYEVDIMPLIPPPPAEDEGGDAQGQ